MIPRENIRKTEVQQADGSWVEVLFSQIEPGDILRQFEPDGTLVEWEGKSEFKALSHVALEVDHV